MEESKNEYKTRFGSPTFDPVTVLTGETLSNLIHKIGHEIGNPLTAIISLGTIIERFSRESPSADVESTFKKTSGYAGSIIDEAWKISALSERLVMLLSQKPGNVGPCNLGEALAKSLQKQRLRNRGRTPNVLVSTLGDKPCIALIDSEQLAVFFGEIFLNAQNAIGYELGGDDANHPVTALLRTEGDRVLFALTNDTPEPRSGDLDSLFDLCTTTYGDRKHLGIGLTMCWTIISRFGGTMRLIEQSRQSGYSFTVEVSLPAAA